MSEQRKLEIWWHEVTPANIFSFDNEAKYNNEGNGGENTNDSQDSQLLINPVSKSYWKKKGVLAEWCDAAHWVFLHS